MILLLSLLLTQEVELEARAASVRPKFRLRDGEKSLKGISVFSDELDAEDDVFSPGGSLALRWNDERFHVEYWRLTAEGSSTLEEPKNWGGTVFPVGTPTDTEVLFDHLEIGWRHRFEPAEWLRVDAGLDVEWLVVDADVGLGTTRMGGVFPTPQLTATALPWPWLEITAGLGGFYLPWRSGDTSCLDPVEYTFEVRGRWDRYSVGLGYELHHVHLEENSGHTEEDVVHLRLRGVVLSVEVRF